METLKKTQTEIKMEMKSQITLLENSVARFITRMNQTEYKLSGLMRR